ncbi:MAG: hypothetical protein HRF45_10910 [Fimbriimonadia bacterium]|jgi:hypothetical protein
MTPERTAEIDGARFGYPHIVRLRRIEDLGTLIRVAQDQREAKMLAAHFSKVFGFRVTEAVVQAAAVIGACWDADPPKRLEDVVVLSRTKGPLLLEMLRVCNELNGWADGPFGSAAGGSGC